MDSHHRGLIPRRRVLWCLLGLPLAALLGVCAPAMAASGGPDLFGYTWRDSTEPDGPAYLYEEDLTASNLNLGDDVFQTVDIGFAFTLYDQEHTQIDVHSNGALTFGTTSFIRFDHACPGAIPLDNGEAPLDVPAILPYWIDIDPTQGGGIYAWTGGVAPNRKFVVEWYNTRLYDTTGSIVFEAKLFESDGHIEFHYDDLDVDDDSKDWGLAAAVGLSPSASEVMVISCDSSAIFSDDFAIGVYPPSCADEDNDGVSVCDGDCDDLDRDVHPGAEEICNGVDDDCTDGVPADEIDGDSDGWAPCQLDCNDGDPTLNLDDADSDGFTTCDGDCDDDDPDRSPDDADGDGASGCDDDCDDTNAALNDNDEDNDGVSTCDGDCDDDDAAVQLGAAELCDGKDNDCDGDIDENPNCGDDDDATDGDDDDVPPGWDIAYGCIVECSHASEGGSPAGALAALIALCGVGWTTRRRRERRP